MNPDLPLCAWCDRPIPDGEGRMRFASIAFHVRCWGARVAGERPPGPEAREQ